MPSIYLYTPAEISGVEGVVCDSETEVISFDGHMLTSRENGMEVISMSGRCVARTAGNALDTISLQPGIYLCRSGNHVVKIAVGRDY